MLHINPDTLEVVGRGYVYVPEHRLYGMVNMEQGTISNAIFGEHVPNPSNIAARGRKASEDVHCLWGDWCKRKRALQRQGVA